MDENITCCLNCKCSSGRSDNLYCYRLGTPVDKYSACLMYEDRLRTKEGYYEKSNSNGQ
ncbi:MAG: hypothetical protein IJK30_07440 [Ruminococcus sp.]|nr:hypothetical protein [Ruminococcus sp.]